MNSFAAEDCVNQQHRLYALTMDKSEQAAKAFLQHSGFTNIIFEPDGNVTPDFLVDGNIAVEVRRLNHLETTSGTPKGLEDADFKLYNMMTALTTAASAASFEQSWWIFYRFSRPVDEFKSIRKNVEAWLKSLRSIEPPQRREMTWEKFTVYAIPASIKRSAEFRIAGMFDNQADGSLIQIVEESARYCIQEKSTKTAAFRSKYRTWWLLLVDHISHALDDFERDLLQSHLKIEHDWDRVVIVNPNNPAIIVEIPNVAG